MDEETRFSAALAQLVEHIIRKYWVRPGMMFKTSVLADE
jgi:hypothetical protein